jgi:hypothetical protein
MKKAVKALQYIKEHGLSATLLKIIQVVYRNNFPYVQMIYAAEPSFEPCASAKMPCTLGIYRYSQIADIPTQDLESIANIEGHHKFMEKCVQPFLSEGANLWLVKCEGKVAAYRFSTMGCENAAKHFPFFPMGANEALLFSGETFSNHRGKGISPIMSDYMVGQLLSEGASRAYVACGIWNIANRRSLAKTRFKLIGAARILNIFGHRITIWTDIEQENGLGATYRT